VLQVFQTETFSAWLSGLRDRRARAKIQARLDRAMAGNFGDVKSLGKGVYEMRVDYGPGYRVYFLQRGLVAVVLLCGGDKGTQSADIKRAIRLAQDWRW